MVMMVWNVSICPSLFFDEELYQWCSFLFLIFFDRSEPLITPEKLTKWKKRWHMEKKRKDRKRKKKKEFLKEEPQHYIFCFSAVSCFKSGTWMSDCRSSCLFNHDIKKCLYFTHIVGWSRLESVLRSHFRNGVYLYCKKSFRKMGAFNFRNKFCIVFWCSFI